jgi:3-phenylpropionate/trans-cinnamate dioxygenase ferredoxin subunit
MWHEACDTDDAEDGVSVFIEGGRVAVFRSDDEVHAVNDVCTHAGASLAEGGVRDGVVRCPRHGAPFDLKTGEALGPPGREGVKTYDTKVEDGFVYLRAEDKGVNDG